MPSPTRRGGISLPNAIFLFVILAALTTVLVIRGAGNTGDTAASEVIFANASTYAEAQSTASAEGKLVFVLATADWCPPCRSLRSGTLADPAVQAELQKVAVPYKLDVTDRDLPPNDAQLAASLGVSSIPALFVIDENNTILASTVGDMSASQFKSWLSAAEARR